MTILKPVKPEEAVRQRVIKDLQELGWKEAQLRWKPEWQVPDTPHDLTKRERGQKYATCGSADLVAFADESGEWFALQVVFEFKAPDIDAGRSQLIRYLSNEPMAKMGFWTNGSQTLAVYKRHQSDWVFVENAALPHPSDDMTQPPDVPPSWDTMRLPTEAELSGALKRLVATVVVSDPHVVRREDQLRELLHILLVKLDSDAVASRSANRDKAVRFRILGDAMTKVALTAARVREDYREYYHKQRTRIFNASDREELFLSDETIFAVVAELSPYRILGDDVDLLAKAFQIFRTSALKSGEGQYLTPLRVVRPAVMAMEVTSSDKVIDPACGSGAFVVEALRQVAQREFPNEDEAYHLVKWANDNLYGVDKDDIGVKLTKATMVAMRDGSTHVLLGDAVRTNQWPTKYPKLSQELGSTSEKHGLEQFTVAITNPPFGSSLKVKAADCRAAGYSISTYAAMKGPKDFADLEIGLVYLEQCYRLLRVGGRIGIVLPETYFFSHSYRWLPFWLKDRLALRGMLNIPMEAFEEFCRAKTNFYIFEKIGHVEADFDSSSIPKKSSKALVGKGKIK
ncbi:restriction endonuclease subunit M [Sphingomicrobium astaxanthinifaciens]|uniref:restriction endonuclease subunit M n=1 Tax=Sphingomicrobium astaxanthinifaciens TaxID=1227949 RepID=UPI001FCC1E4C|nr:N-6 DNA methylase [Sphingomicrobium astaxanthinifaciens]MCJ7420951.1 N-6 DNA methylase [Sphingomicrobium astaxanthinifaciens]